MLFLRAVLDGFRECFRVDFGTILEENCGILSYNLRCSLHIAGFVRKIWYLRFWTTVQRFGLIFKVSGALKCKKM